MNLSGPLRKMKTEPGNPVRYQLHLGDEYTALTEFVGHEISLKFTGNMSCVACGRAIKKTFNQGYCFPCTRSLAETDGCLIRPETCHFHKGTCRDEVWGQQHCMQTHYVYLAVSSGLKVGITRAPNLPSRWLDQGATQAMVIHQVNKRLDAGLVEIELAKFVADKTNWRAMLQGTADLLDLPAERDRILAEAYKSNPELILPGQAQTQSQVMHFTYPIEAFPVKIKSHDFDKNPLLQGRLTGIKGQYLMFGDTVINLRKFAGYHVEFAG